MRTTLALSLLAFASTASAQSLSMPGDCPGVVDISVTGVTPGGDVRFLFGGAGEGDDVVGAGGCTGTVTGLAGLRPGPKVTDSDGDGALSFAPSLPGGACGNPVQVLDLTTCTVSNVAYPGAGGGPALTTYEDSFVNAVTPTSQCDSWLTFVDALPASGITAVRMSGTFDEVGIECTDPAVAQGLADAMRTRADFDMMCDGHQWTNCGSRYDNEVWIDPPALCSGSNCPDPGYLMRPCIGNANWGGVNTATCSSQPDQTQRLEFF